MTRKTLLTTGALSTLLVAVAAPASAAVDPETTFVFNTLLFLVMGFLVMFMAAGFAMLESGMVRRKNTAAICLKNIALYSIAGLAFYLVGYNLMYDGVNGGFLGSFSMWNPGAGEAAYAAAIEAKDQAKIAETFGKISETGYAAASDWFFQMVFVATTASIVSGTVAERIKVWPFMIFVVFLAAIIYPIQGSWQWGGGWLAELGFSDFAGSTLVHSTGGWAALTGAIILGARRGKYKDGRVIPIQANNIPMVTLGTFILWLGWFGFNGGSQLALGSASDAIAISTIFVNTNAAAAGGVVVVMALTQLLFKKIDLTMVLNGALAGLVSITAGPDSPTIWQSALIGGVGGVLVVVFVPLLDRLKIDDVVGAISVHLVAGIWGTLAVPLTNSGASFVNQAIGIVAIGGFVVVCSTIVWLALKYTIGIRVSEEAEEAGLDQSELGLDPNPPMGQVASGTA